MFNVNSLNFILNNTLMSPSLSSELIPLAKQDACLYEMYVNGKFVKTENRSVIPWGRRQSKDWLQEGPQVIQG